MNVKFEVCSRAVFNFNLCLRTSEQDLFYNKREVNEQTGNVWEVIVTTLMNIKRKSLLNCRRLLINTKNIAILQDFKDWIAHLSAKSFH